MAQQPMAQPTLAQQPMAQQPMAQPTLAQQPTAQPTLAQQPTGYIQTITPEYFNYQVETACKNNSQCVTTINGYAEQISKLLNNF